MFNDRFTELLWNHLRLAQQAALREASAHPDSEKAVEGSPDAGFAPTDASGEAAGVADDATTGEANETATAQLLPSVSDGPSSGTLSFLSQARAFVEEARALGSLDVAPTFLLDGARQGFTPMFSLGADVAIATGGAPVAQDGQASGGPSTGQPGDNSGETGGTGSAGDTTNAPDTEPQADAGQELFGWIGNEDAADAIYQAYLTDPNFAGVMEVARTTIHAVAPAGGGVGHLISGHVDQIWTAQFNVFRDDDRNSQSLEAPGGPETVAAGLDIVPDMGQSAASGANDLTNDIELRTDRGMDGMLIVTGNYYEYNIVLQVNILFDSDQILQTSELEGQGMGGIRQEVAAGGNTQVNEAGIVDIAGGAPILLGGDYISDFTLVQYSFMSDVDTIGSGAVLVFGTDGAIDAGALIQSITGGGNAQSNNASYLHVGGEANIWDLGSLTGFKLSFFTGESTAADLFTLADGEHLPEGAQFIDGDYYEINVLIQVNALYDSDTINQDAVGGGNGIGQNGSAGDNVGSNSAYIIDAGSSSVLVIAGDYIESNTVVQANFIQDDDRIYQNAEAETVTVAEAIDADTPDNPGVTDVLLSMSA